MWLVHSLIWTVLTALILYQTPRGYLFESYGPVVAVFQTLGVVVIMQGVLVGEKKDGTAAWVMSKPTSRSAFILSKLIANSLGILTTMVVLSGAIAYIFFTTEPMGVPTPFFSLAALGVTCLSHMFYTTLTLMLGTFFKGYGPVIGIDVGFFLISQELIGRLPELGNVLPWNLVLPITGGPESAFLTALHGQSLAPYIPLIVVVGLECILFTLISLWRFSREEF